MTKKIQKKKKWQDNIVQYYGEPISDELFQKYLEEISILIYELKLAKNLDLPSSKKESHEQ